MKRTAPFLLAAGMLFGVLIPALAAASLGIGTATGAAGNNSCIALTLANNGTPLITALTTDILYDGSKLTPTGATTSAPGKLLDWNVIIAGRLRITLYGGAGVMADGPVASVCFNTTAGICATYPLAHGPGTPSASDTDANPVAILGTAGSLTTTGCATCTLSCTASASPASGVAPMAVSFTGTATPQNCSGAPAYSWTFGDGTTSTQQNPDKTYAAAGSYAWTLTASIGQVSCTQSGTVTVTAPSNRTLAIGLVSGTAGTNLCVPVTLSNGGAAVITALSTDIVYDASKLTPTAATTAVPGKLLDWNIVAAGKVRITLYGGAGVIADGVAASVCFNTTVGQCSTYPLAHGPGTPSASDTDANPVAIIGTAGSLTTEGCDCRITCTASASPSSGNAPLAVSFAATSTAQGCSGPTTYDWDFGDGQSSSQQNPSHTYSNPGTYAWLFNATAGGKTCSQTGSVTVTQVCTAGYCGDCNGDGNVSIGEVQKSINCFLGIACTCLAH